MLVAGPAVAIAVTILHSLGFVFGWGIPKLLGYSERVARTTSVETGIQSSALAVVLATRHFPNPIHSSLPGALSGTVQSILGMSSLSKSSSAQLSTQRWRYSDRPSITTLNSSTLFLQADVA
jgi:predicted Na+-dependent transporter